MGTLHRLMKYYTLVINEKKKTLGGMSEEAVVAGFKLLRIFRHLHKGNDETLRRRRIRGWVASIMRRGRVLI
jgi:hypothetical protein